MTTIKRPVAGLLAVLLCISLLLVPVHAYGRVDAEAAVSLDLAYVDSDRDRAVSGMELRIYKVFDMSDAVRFTPTEVFQSYEDVVNLDMTDMDQDQWMDLASTLASLVAKGDLAPTQSGETDETGHVRFSELTVGMYLVVGDRVRIGRYSYTPQSFLLTLPQLTEEEEWDYDAEVSGKYTRRSHSSNNDDPATISRNVLKVWNDAGKEDQRPASITVELLRDGEVYDTVTLDAGNNWRHSWTKLSDEYTWQVVEVEVPEDYTFAVTQEGNTFVVTNTIDRDDDDPPPEDPPPEDPPPEEPPTENPPPEEDLPQTGTLWWPVQALTIAGILLFTAGWLVNRRSRKSRDER